LERGARRPRRLGDAVPLRVDEVPATDHREDVAGLGVDREQRALQIGRERALVVGRAATLLEVVAIRRALELAVGVHARFDLVELRLEGLLRGLLHVEIERGVDAQALLVEITAEARLEERRA